MVECRLAIRRLMQQPAATLASIGTLAAAIGAAAATWSLLSAVLLTPLPVRDSTHLFVVAVPPASGRDARIFNTGFTYPYYRHLRESGVFEQVTAIWHPAMRLLVDAGGMREQGSVSFVMHDYLEVLGVGVQRGRAFRAGDDREGAAAVGILSDRYWHRTFGGDETVVGRTILVNHHPVAIVGVAARGFRGIDLAEAPDVFVPFHVISEVAGPPTNYFARPNTGMSPTAGVVLIGRSPLANVQLDARLSVLPPIDSGRSARLVASPLDVEAVPQATRAGMNRFARLLAATVALLLIAGCLTVGTLLLVRTEARQSEFATCLALGASRRRLARSIAVEGAILSLAGAGCAIPASLAIFRCVQAFQLPGGVSIEALGLSLDLSVVAAAAACSLAATGGISLVAAWLGFRADLAEALRARSGSTRPAGRRSRAVLVVGQVAVALILSAAAGVFTRTLIAALALNAGFDPARLVTGTLSLRPYEYDVTRAAAFFERLEGRLTAVPSIAAIAFFENTGGMSGRLAIDGVPRQFPTQVDFISVDHRYFGTMRMPILTGRDFAASDGPRAPLVAIVSESYARLLGPDAIGRRITMPFHRVGEPPAQVTVVGVVPDVIGRVSVLEPLVLYQPLAQGTASTYRQWVARAARPEAAMRDISTAIRDLDRTIVPPVQTTMRDALARQMNAQQFGAVVLGTLGGVAVVLTLLGTYVLAESTAVMRTREMGVRAALGATGRQLTLLAIAETARLAAFGLLAGLFVVWAGAGTIRSFMFRVQPLDPLTLGAVSLGIAALTLGVALRPALRVSRLDLATVLKQE